MHKTSFVQETYKYIPVYDLSSACCLLHSGFLLGFIFDPEDGGDMFLRNVG
jgi:hypothetical protein